MEHLSNDQKDNPNQHENSHMQCDETVHPIVRVNGNWDNNMIIISQWRESHCKTNISVRRKKEIQKSKIVKISLGSE